MTGISMLCGESPSGGSYRPTQKRLASFTPWGVGEKKQ